MVASINTDDWVLGLLSIQTHSGLVWLGNLIDLEVPHWRQDFSRRPSFTVPNSRIIKQGISPSRSAAELVRIVNYAKGEIHAISATITSILLQCYSLAKRMDLVVRIIECAVYEPREQMISWGLNGMTGLLTDGKAAGVTSFAGWNMIRAAISAFRLEVRGIKINVDELLVEVTVREIIKRSWRLQKCQPSSFFRNAFLDPILICIPW